MSQDGVVVVGTGQAAAQLAMSLRQRGYDQPITLIGEEPHLPYERPPLSKAHLAAAPAAEVALRPEEFWARKHVRIRTGEIVDAVDRPGRRVRAGGEWIGYDHLVLATGADPRRPTVPGVDTAGVHVLRTRDEADRLRDELSTARDVVVVGAGFIGLEVAAAARLRGATVTVLEATDRAMGRVVSEATASGLVDEHRARGVDVRFGSVLTEVLAGPDGRVRAARVAGGGEVVCDLLVVGIGVVPRTELAEAAGLRCADGIVVDDVLRTQDPHISAIGDCANYPSAHAGGAPVRLESVQNAVDHARCVADGILGTPRSYGEVPWFWTHQYDLTLQVAGIVAGHDTAVTRHGPGGSGFSVFCFTGPRLVGVESVNRVADHLLARTLLAGEHSLTPDAAADPESDLTAFRPPRQPVSSERNSS